MTARRATVVSLILASTALAACGSGDGAGNPESALSPAEATEPLPPGAPSALAALREDANRILDGGTEAFEERLTELRGVPVVVNKWASWCGPCRLEFPYFQSQAAARGAEIAFLGVDANDSRDAAATFLGELPLPYPSYYDPDSRISALIGAPAAFPATAYYDSSGELAFTHQGVYATEEDLVADIERHAR